MTGGTLVAFVLFQVIHLASLALYMACTIASAIFLQPPRRSLLSAGERCRGGIPSCDLRLIILA